jgi:NhaA family Na+:H+ antiporter
VPGSLVGVVVVDLEESSSMPSRLFQSARPTFVQSDRMLARAAQPFVRFLHVEAAGGILLLLATMIALVWANSPWQSSYESLWSTRIRLEIGGYSFDEDLVHVVNDLLMAGFFFVVGMEIKRELVVGQLADRRAVVLPAMAALGGMLVPALIYTAFNAGRDGGQGWGNSDGDRHRLRARSCRPARQAGPGFGQGAAVDLGDR